MNGEGVLMSSNEKTTVQKLGNGVYRITSTNRSAVSGKFVTGQTPKADKSAPSSKTSPSFSAGKKYT